MPAWTLIPSLHWSGRVNVKIGKSSGFSYLTVNNSADYLEPGRGISRPPAASLFREYSQTGHKTPQALLARYGSSPCPVERARPGHVVEPTLGGAGWEGFVIERILAACTIQTARSMRIICAPAIGEKSICSSRRMQSYGHWRSNSRRARASTIWHGSTQPRTSPVRIGGSSSVNSVISSRVTPGSSATSKA